MLRQSATKRHIEAREFLQAMQMRLTKMSWRKAKAKSQSEDGKGGLLESRPEPEVPKMDLTKVQVA